MYNNDEFESDLFRNMEEENKENLNQPSKYEVALGKYNTDLKDDEIASKVSHLIEKHADENNTPEVKKFLFNCIDLTTLKCTDSETSVMEFTEKVNDFDDKYPDLKNVAAICVYPNMAEIVNDTLEADHVKIACVSGGFPSSQTFMEVKVAETAMALHAGADEIDIVISVGKFLSGDYEGMCDEIQELKDICGEKHMKVILETGALGSASNIKKAAILAMYSGADFIKTSTGKEQPAATPEAAYVMCQAIKEYYLETERKVGFKPAGGLNTVHDAIVYYTIVKEVLGKDWLNNDLFRLGTSRLANKLLSDILVFLCCAKSFVAFHYIINISSQRPANGIAFKVRQKTQSLVPEIPHCFFGISNAAFILDPLYKAAYFLFRSLQFPYAQSKFIQLGIV